VTRSRHNAFDGFDQGQGVPEVHVSRCVECREVARNLAASHASRYVDLRDALALVTPGKCVVARPWATVPQTPPKMLLLMRVRAAVPLCRCGCGCR